jgi:hypothetical protein
MLNSKILQPHHSAKKRKGPIINRTFTFFIFNDTTITYENQ